MKMNDLKDWCLIVAAALFGTAWIIFWVLFATVLAAAPFVLIAAGCFYAWKAIIG